MSAKNICLIGFGEVGQILADDLAPSEITAWDILFRDADSRPSVAASSSAVLKANSCAEAVNGADIIISAVTAAETLSAATSAASGLKSGAFFFDVNSASPGAKKNAAKIIENVGAYYVEGAIMSPIGPKRMGTPILLGGPSAHEFAPLAEAIGFSAARVFSSEAGKAAAAKMCRSVMIKGIETLLSESLLSARYYGVEETVINSLSDLFPGPDWEGLSRYMISRTLEHGARRAEEMREVARTVSEAGIAPSMSLACAERQDWAAAYTEALSEEKLGPMLDTILNKRPSEEEIPHADH